MRVLVCGSRTWRHPVPIQALLDGLRQLYPSTLTVIEGCARGADEVACREEGNPANEHEHYRADWGQYGKAAGPIRNQTMLDKGKPNVVFAFVDKPLEESRGTHSMVSLARKADVPVYVTRRLA